MDKPQPQYHISDITWRRIQPHLPGQKGQWGGIARDNRLFIDAVLWVLRTGAPWRKLPDETVGHSAPPFHPLERQTVMGEVARNTDRRPGLRVAHRRHRPLRGASRRRCFSPCSPADETPCRHPLPLAVDAHGVPVRVPFAGNAAAAHQQAVILPPGKGLPPPHGAPTRQRPGPGDGRPVQREVPPPPRWTACSAAAPAAGAAEHVMTGGSSADERPVSI